MQIRRAPVAFVMFLFAAAAVMAQQAPAPAGDQKAGDQKTAAPTQGTPEQQDQAALMQLVDAASAGTAPAAAVPVKWVQHHFIRSQGDTVYIPFTFSVDKSALTGASTALYVRAVSKAPAGTSALQLPGAKPSHPWDTLHFIQIPADGNVSRAIALPAGTYDVYIALKDRTTAAAPAAKPGAAPAAAPPPSPATTGLLKQELTVPSFSGPDLTTSSVILARSLEQLAAPPPAEQQQDNPYVFGPLKVTPSLDGTFPKTGPLQVLFWIYGASHTGGKPDVQVEFNFHQKLPEGEKYFNKTAPQRMNAETLPPEFNLTAGHQLLSSLEIPLASFPAGNYRLEIKVTDNPSGKSLTNNVDFTVTGS